MTEALISQTLISQGELLSKLKEEFSRLRPATCATCIVPAPIRKLPPIDYNWQLAASRPCKEGCREVFRDIESRLGPLYRLSEAA